jgi:hypothetical protein
VERYRLEPQDRGDSPPVAPGSVLRAKDEGLEAHGRVARRVNLGPLAMAFALPEGRARSRVPGGQGRPMWSSDLLRTGLHPALRRAGRRQVRFHDLRHSFASNLLGAGVDVVTVSKALGHANVHITLVTYCARDSEGTARGRGRIGETFGTEWKQNGNIGLRNGLSSLIE